MFYSLKKRQGMRDQKTKAQIEKKQKKTLR